MLGDHILSPSGIGTQSKYMAEALLKTGKYQIVQLGGAIRHSDNRPMKFNEYGDDFIIYPVEGYGNADIIRSIVRTFRPDILFYITDPRFYIWLWQIENEIRPLVPFVYWHVWDNIPLPTYNKVLYESTDVIATISKVTSHIVKNVAPNVEEIYLPHSINTEVFKRHSDEDIIKFKNENLSFAKDKFVFFWNNRNARRKQSGSLIFWFKSFLDKVGHDKAMLLMHTDPKDPNGQDLNVIIHELGLNNKQVLLSQDKLPPEHLAILYNCVDTTINIADAEGFGLGTLESLACETPIVVNMTGGLQEQVTDGKEWFGIGIEPCSKSIIGSQETPFIYEDRINEKDCVDALEKIYNMSKNDRREMGKKGRNHVLTNYNFEKFCKSWDELLTSVHERHGSWNNRKLYKSYELITL